ncbi:MAG: ATPase, partial [Magnetospirillum sp.]
SDNGIGIECGQDYEERIFGLFQRLHQRHEHGGGTGIGLPICRKIIQRHGGRIWAESEGLGKGTSLIFTLPKA